MSTDEPDAEDLAEAFPHVAQLEEQLKEADIDVGDIPQRKGTTRRDLLAGSAGLLGLGGILTGATGGAQAGDDQAGQFGTQAAPLDGYVEDLYDKNGNRVAELPGDGSLDVLQDLSAESVKTDQVNNIVWADPSSEGSVAVSDAVNRIPSGESGVLAFYPGAVYEFDSTATVDADVVRVIKGNNAYLVPQSDIVCIDLVGNKTSGSAAPSTSNTSFAESEMGTVVKNLQSYSTTDPYVGTPLRIRDTFGTIVTECNFANVKDGIEVTNRNRNLIINGNHVWDCNRHCVFYNGGNIHQSIIANNHLSYGLNVLKMDGGELVDIHITGNDLEGGVGEQQGIDRIIDIDARNGGVWGIGITNNTLAGHNQVIDCARFIADGVNDGNSGLENSFGVRFTGNYVESATTGIRLENYRGVSIGNNYLRNFGSEAILGVEQLQNININNNQFDGVKTDATGDGVVIQTDELVLSVTVQDNNYDNWLGQAVQITDDAGSGTAKFGIKVTGNMVYLDTSIDITEWIIDINDSQALGLHHVSENQIRARDSGEDGIRLATSGSHSSTICKNNIIDGLSTGTPYDLPEDSPSDIIVADNLG